MAACLGHDKEELQLNTYTRRKKKSLGWGKKLFKTQKNTNAEKKKKKKKKKILSLFLSG